MNQDISQRNWYVIYTKSRSEKSVAGRLASMGIEVYCPVRKYQRRWSDRWKWVEEPLFRSYCFVKIEESKRDRVFSVPGIVRYMYWLGSPAVVKEYEIDRIKSWLNDFDHDQIEIFNFEEGDIAEISSGPLINRKGRVLDKQGNYLYLKLSGLGLTMRVDLSTNKVQKTLNSGM